MRRRSGARSKDPQARQHNAGHEDPRQYDELREGWLNQRRRRFFADAVAAAHPSTVVEIGCGTGRMLCEIGARLPATHFIGVEPIRGYVEYGRCRAAADHVSNVELVEGTGEILSTLIGAGSVDVVISSDVLHHVDHLDEVVRQVRAISRVGAHWILVEPSAANPYVASYQAFAPGERNFRARPFLHAAADAGWQLAARGRMFMIPAVVAEPPQWLIEVERRFERFPVLAGAVHLRLTAV